VTALKVGQRFRLTGHRVHGGGRGAWGTVVEHAPDPTPGYWGPRDYRVMFDDCPVKVYRLGAWEMSSSLADFILRLG
jgi:hypothetical protein